MREKETQVIAIPQPEIVAAWKRGDIDGAFVWDPALSELKKDGKVLLTCRPGRRARRADLRRAGRDRRIRQGQSRLPRAISSALIDGYYDSFRPDKAAWGPDFENAKVIAGLQGGTPAENAGAAQGRRSFIPLDEQVSEAWLGGGEKSGVAKILKDTAAFLKDQHKITAVKDSYAAFVDPQFAGGRQGLELEPTASRGRPSSRCSRKAARRPPCCKFRDASVTFPASDGNVVHALDRVSLDIPARRLRRRAWRLGLREVDAAQRHGRVPAAHAGSITLDGVEVTGPGADRGVVFQKDTLLPWKTVVDNVALGLKFAGVARRERLDRARELLRAGRACRTSPTRPPYELSGGMRQRVGIARALATDPAILLMDEPFGALDSLTREHMQELLVDVWDRTGKQIFFITHSIEEALFLGTHLVVMSPRPGRICAAIRPRFCARFAATGDARAVKYDPPSGRLRDDIRALVHRIHRSAVEDLQ